jgi:hypothetical protein
MFLLPATICAPVAAEISFIRWIARSGRYRWRRTSRAAIQEKAGALVALSTPVAPK